MSLFTDLRFAQTRYLCPVCDTNTLAAHVAEFERITRTAHGWGQRGLLTAASRGTRF